MDELLQTYDHFFLAVVVLVGLCLGSFATAAAYRIPRGEQFITGHSRCPECRHTLGLPDLFPLLSWLWLRGRCRHCGVKFGASYLLIECATALLVVLVYLRFGITPQSGVLILSVVCMVILSVVDYEYSTIPDGINITMLYLATLYQIFQHTPAAHFFLAPVMGVALAYSLRRWMWAWKRQEGLGLGDVKLAAAIGMFLDAERITTFLFISGVLGIFTAFLWKLRGKGQCFPFGPALCMALFLCLVVPEVSQWWQNLLARWVVRA